MGLFNFITSFFTSSKIVELDNVSFDRNIQKYQMAVVMFYVPWCKYCQKFKPEYTKAASELSAFKPPIQFVKFNCEGPGGVICEKYGVDRYPTIKIFRHGRDFRKYGGKQDAPSVAEFLKNQAEEVSHPVKPVK